MPQPTALRAPVAALLLTLAASLAAPASAAPPVPTRDFSLAWTEHGYLGRHRDLLGAAERLHAATVALCQAPSRARLETTRARWLDAHLAWRRVDGAGAAPTVIARSGRMLDFRPARVRDIDARIARGDGPDPANVAVRGFGTLEYLLYGNPGDNRDADTAAALDALRQPARCAYLNATAALLLADADATDTGWRQQLERLGGNVDLPRRNLLAENIGLMVSGLDGALARFPKVREAKREAWPDWRSASTRAALGAQLDGFALAYAGSADGHPQAASLSALLRTHGHAAVDRKVLDAYRSARQAWQALPEAVAADGAEAARQRFTAAVSALKGTLEDDVAGALGVVLGFNDNDGD